MSKPCGRITALLVLAGIAAFAPAFVPVCADAAAADRDTEVAALPARQGLGLAIVGARVDSADRMVLLCELSNLTGATLRGNAAVPVREEKSSTTVSADGRRTTTRTSRSMRRDSVADGWQVTFGYLADGKARAMTMGFHLPSVFEQPFIEGEKRQTELVLSGAGGFTPEFLAALDEVRVRYTPAAPVSDRPRDDAMPAAYTVRIGGEELRKLMAPSAEKR